MQCQVLGGVLNQGGFNRIGASEAGREGECVRVCVRSIKPAGLAYGLCWSNLGKEWKVKTHGGWGLAQATG